MHHYTLCALKCRIKCLALRNFLSNGIREKEYYKLSISASLLIRFLSSCRFKFCIQQIVVNLALLLSVLSFQPEGQCMLRKLFCHVGGTLSPLQVLPSVSQPSPPARGSLELSQGEGLGLRACSGLCWPCTLCSPTCLWVAFQAPGDVSGFSEASCLVLQVFIGRFLLSPHFVCLFCFYSYSCLKELQKWNTPVVLNSIQSENAFSSHTFFFRTPLFPCETFMTFTYYSFF